MFAYDYSYKKINKPKNKKIKKESNQKRNTMHG